MKIRFLKISQVIDNQVIVKSIETENSIADGIVYYITSYIISKIMAKRVFEPPRV
jgi:hypothetical protein